MTLNWIPSRTAWQSQYKPLMRLWPTLQPFSNPLSSFHRLHVQQHKYATCDHLYFRHTCSADALSKAIRFSLHSRAWALVLHHLHFAHPDNAALLCSLKSNSHLKICFVCSCGNVDFQRMCLASLKSSRRLPSHKEGRFSLQHSKLSMFVGAVCLHNQKLNQANIHRPSCSSIRRNARAAC